MITKKFGFWCLVGAAVSSALLGQWYAPLVIITLFMYDAIKPEDKQ